MDKVYEKLRRCVQCVKEKVDFVPRVALVLGSGLGDFADNIKVTAELPYGEIEEFPVSTVPGHAGRFIFGYLDDGLYFFRLQTHAFILLSYRKATNSPSHFLASAILILSSPQVMGP